MSNLFMRFPEGKTKAFTMSYDDGVEQDIRLLDIMKKHGLKGTFNLNSGEFALEGTVYPEGQIHRRMTKKQVTELFQNSGQEVAVHGLTHPFINYLPNGRAVYEVVEDRRRLEEIFHYTVRGMAYPYGAVDDETVNVLKTAGIVYSRTTAQTESFSIPQDWLRLNPTCHHNNKRLLELGHKFIDTDCKGAPQLFYLWGHSYEFEKDDNWNVIEEFAELIGKNEKVWYATNIQIYDYISAYHQLRFNIDMNLVENPTAYDLFFTWENKDYCVKAGEILSF